MSGTTFFAVSNSSQLDAAIAAIDAASLTAPSATAYTIDVISDFTLTAGVAPIDLAASDTLFITGNTPSYGNTVATLDGDGTYRGFVALSGIVQLDSLIVQGTNAQGGNGGNGASAGGGGAGLGGGLFVGTAAAVTLSNDSFSATTAVGGNGGNTASTGTGAGGTGEPGGFGSGAPGGTSGSFGGGGGSGATGGFGAGGNAGGGLAAGGAIFVQQGGSLTFTSGSASAGGLTPGSPAARAYGSGIFIQGTNTITLGNATITGVIADQTGSGGTGANAGAGSVLIQGATTLSGANTYTGGTQIDGSLTLNAKTAAGTGEISFASGTLTVAAGDTPANKIGNFINGDGIDLQNIGLATTAKLAAGNVLAIGGGTTGPLNLHLDPAQNYANNTFILRPDTAATGTLLTVMQTRFTVASEADLDTVLSEIDIGGKYALAKTAYAIALTAGFTLSADPDAIDLAAGDSLTIDGANQIIDGGGHYRGFFVYAGTVRLQNLTLQNTVASGGNGGNGAIPGGGGAGLGGGLFIAAGASVTVSNVNFLADSAIGGNAGSVAGNGNGGGGGLGGHGGNGGNGRAGGGGGVGNTATGGAYGTPDNGGPGILIGAAGASSGTGTYSSGSFSPGGGGANGGGGGLAGTFSGSGRGARSSPGTAGAGGVSSNANFGGGAGSGQLAGFGGGGAAPNGAVNGSPNPSSGIGGWGGGGSGTIGGFGGGTGIGGAGGGLGAGGAIFVQQGGTLILDGGAINGGTVAGGTGTTAAGNGSAYGSGIYFQGSNQLLMAPGAGQTLTISDVIADQRATSPTLGASSVVMFGTGTVALSATNTDTGGLILKSGSVSLQAQGAAGTGPISFAYGAAATLIAGSGDVPTNTIHWFLPGGTIDLQGIGTATSATLGAGDVLAVTGGTTNVNLNLYTGQIFTGETFAVATDHNGGTLLTAVTVGNDHSPYISGSATSGNDHTPFAPLARVAVTDLDTQQTETATLTLSSTANGTLSNLGGGTYNAQTGVYTVSGTAAAVTTALEALIFTPTDHQVAPGQNVRTTFSLSVTDGTMTAATPFTVYVTALNDPPAIGGLPAEQEAYWNVPFKAFAGTTITDPDYAARETLTIGVSGGDSSGTLSLSLAGYTLTHTASGTYTLTGNTAATSTPAAIGTAIDAIAFTPLPNTAVPGYTITDIGVSVSDGIAPPVLATTQVLAGLPIFAGVVAGQSVVDGQTIAPFSSVRITDSAGLIIQGLTIVLYDQNNLYTPTDVNGTLSGAGLTRVGAGTYTLTPGTTASVSAQLDALTFTPSIQSTTATTGFILQAFDGATTADNYDTIVTAAPAPAAAAISAPLAATISASADSALTSAPPLNFLPAPAATAPSLTTSLAQTVRQSAAPLGRLADLIPPPSLAQYHLSGDIPAASGPAAIWSSAPLLAGQRSAPESWQPAPLDHLSPANQA